MPLFPVFGLINSFWIYSRAEVDGIFRQERRSSTDLVHWSAAEVVLSDPMRDLELTPFETASHGFIAARVGDSKWTEGKVEIGI